MADVDREEWVPKPASGTPARGSWPPFQPGHELSTRHGAYSPRRVDPLAAELVDLVLADPTCAYLQAARWRAGLWAWARAEARVQLLTEWLADHGEGVDSDGSIAPALTALRMWEVRASNARSRLGLDPLSAARLGRDVTAAQVDMARLLSGLDDPPGAAGVQVVRVDGEAEGGGDSESGAESESG